MCGTNGLFVGCPALAFCPLASGHKGSDLPSASASKAKYRSPFKSWERGSSVRSAPRRQVADSLKATETFPVELVPTLNHSVTEDVGEVGRGILATQQLYRYLDFTTKLEHMVVNRTALGIAHNKVGIIMPDEMRFDAFRIYVDEGYHALVARDILEQVSTVTKITPNIPAKPAFMQELESLVEDYPGYSTLIELMFVVVSETLITGNLSQVASSSTTDSEITSTVRDHASDEGRHHAYFRHFLRILWHQLSTREREICTKVYTRLIIGFSTPEKNATVQDLVFVGVSQDAAQAAVEDIFSPAAVTENALRGAEKNMQYFNELQSIDLVETITERAATVR